MKDSFTFLNDLILFSDNNDVESQDDMNEEKEHSDWYDGSIKPDQRVINNIMNYSRALSVMRTKRVGNLSILLN